MSNVTVVITSCNRFDLLNKTIESFNKYNTYPIHEFIIIDDTGTEESKKVLQTIYGDQYTLLFNIPKLGQLKSIDKAYSIVETDYIFHMEDDWEFYDRSFIEKSMEILESNESVLQVWLRHEIDGIVHKPNKEQPNYWYWNNQSYVWYPVKKERGLNGFSFNPHLCRKSDCFKPYAEIGKENDIGIYYTELGFQTAWLEPECGFVRHIGNGRHCPVNKKYMG